VGGLIATGSLNPNILRGDTPSAVADGILTWTTLPENANVIGVDTIRLPQGPVQSIVHVLLSVEGGAG
jgi:hypothetical protein